ncbi:DUF4127 family protein [Clostridium oceanicum]|uniref:DUF4127 family protein n=1 Tax=Clostridium oceanicum TaxID=1543 RepID=A0ABN1JQK0_9CLOT
MKKILYVPLDERPCNYLYPVYMSSTNEELEIIYPSKDLLGNKKEKANLNNLWEFLFSECKTADSIVMSIDMMVYGGLLPSRIHYYSSDHKEQMIENIKKIKKINPKIKIYVSNLIMRTPRYNSSDEEPDYYEEFGERIFKRAYLIDKQNRVGLTKEEIEDLSKIKNEIPQDVIKDYENRRDFNSNINLEIIDLVQNNIIDFLAIPQDDSAEFGYTAIDQGKVHKKIREKRLQRKVHMYPGADEVGVSLMARAVNDFRKDRIKIYPFFSSTLGPQTIPLYEDRPMNESLKFHIGVTNSIIVDDPKEADLILAINSPGKIMQESWDQFHKDISYTSFRNLFSFCEKIKQFIDKNKNVIICDSGFANGGELEFIEILDELNILDKIISYKGWNTNCNSLGTTIGAGIISISNNKNELAQKKNLIYHLFEDVFYQAIVRKDITDNVLPKLGANYFDLKNKGEYVNDIMNKKLLHCYDRYIKNSFKNVTEIKVETFSPWNRMFEVGINLKVDFKLK